jgi:hypothetical protein
MPFPFDWMADISFLIGFAQSSWLVAERRGGARFHSAPAGIAPAGYGSENGFSRENDYDPDNDPDSDGFNHSKSPNRRRCRAV